MNDLIAKVAAGEALLIDVRTDQEWAVGHAKNATHLALDRLQNGELPEADKATPIYTYCRAGGRAGQAKDILTAAGFTNANNLGGLKDWQAMGGAVDGEI